LNEQTNSEPYLYLACTFNIADSDLCKLLIESGLNLHCKYRKEPLFEYLCEKQLYKKTFHFIIYRNALIKELYATFNYSDYERFRQRVIESIDNEDIVLVESDHLEALSLLPKDDKELEEIIGHLKSFEFKEKLIVDYLNVLED